MLCHGLVIVLPIIMIHVYICCKLNRFITIFFIYKLQLSSSLAVGASTPVLENHMLSSEENYEWETASGGHSSRTNSISFPTSSPHHIKTEVTMFFPPSNNKDLPNGKHAVIVDIKTGEKSWTSIQIFTLISLCCTSLCSSLFYSLLAPFFPTEVSSFRIRTNINIIKTPR